MIGDKLVIDLETLNPDARYAAEVFLKNCGVIPTADAIDQLSMVFLPCLRIMCERGYDPNGGTWRKSGRLGILTDVRKKFERLWERAWANGSRHDDSAIDLINYLGMYLRASGERWGEWGEPGQSGVYQDGSVDALGV